MYYAHLQAARAVPERKNSKLTPEQRERIAGKKTLAPRRLFREPDEVMEGMIPRLAIAIAIGQATHRVVINSLTSEKTWLLTDAAKPEWWMIDHGIETAARLLIDQASEQVYGRSSLGVVAMKDVAAMITSWLENDQWTVQCGRDPASRAENKDTSQRQMERSQAFASREK